jgi:hypothetical protein
MAVAGTDVLHVHAAWATFVLAHLSSVCWLFS